MSLLSTIITSFLVCQTIKLGLHWHQFRKINFWVYMEDGGMPSTHAAILFALLASLFYETGVSTIFIVSTVLSLMIINDIMKVNRQPGFQPELMARFIDIREVFRRKLTESIGHTPEQVFIGALVGLLVAGAVYIL